jgi:hypothetical protein
MADQIELSARVKTDGEGDEYYVVVSDMPVMVDLAKSVVFVFHPREGDDFAKLVIRPRFGKYSQPRREPRDGSRPEDGEVNQD